MIKTFVPLRKLVWRYPNFHSLKTRLFAEHFLNDVWFDGKLKYNEHGFGVMCVGDYERLMCNGVGEKW